MFWTILREQFFALWPLLSVYLFFIVLAVYVFYQTPRAFRLKLLLGPVLIAAGVFSFMFIKVTLGYGFPMPLPDKFEYVTHKVILNNSGTAKQWIDVVLVDKLKSKDTRLHRIPYRKEMEEQMKKAQKMQREGGGSVQMEGRPNLRAEKGPKGDGDEYPFYVPRKLQPQEAMPKSPHPGQGEQPEQDTAPQMEQQQPQPQQRPPSKYMT
jgi:hypothetical protein